MTASVHPPVTSTLIAASAGTGKTYQLSLRFISLLALGVAPTHMIALTFTRKAAGEFIDRILRDLARGASSAPEAAKLAEAIRETWRGTNGRQGLCPKAHAEQYPLNQEGFSQLLREMITSLSSVKLTTMDSFFNSLLSMGSPELGLGSITLMDEPQKKQINREALTALFNEVNEDEDKLQNFLELLQDYKTKASYNPKGSKRRDLKDKLLDLIGKYQELFLANPSVEKWSCWDAFEIPNYADMEQPEADYYRRVQKQMQTLSNTANAKPALKKSLLKLVEKMKERKFDSLMTVKNACDTPPKDANGALMQMLTLAKKLMHETTQLVMAQSQRCTRSLYHLLLGYQRHYQLIARNRGLFDFNDITRLIPGLLGHAGAPSRLAYRMDSTYKHWMLDEFQDTADSQWKALTPLLDEILQEIRESGEAHSAQRSLFIVGDDKQSIYGWRGASPEIFRILQQNKVLDTISMTKNWRSSPIILNFVNYVFGYHSAEDKKHVAAKEGLPGYVRVQSFSKEDKELPSREESIGEILDGLPFREKNMSIGILVRGNDEGREITTWLQNNRPMLPVKFLGEVPVGTDSPLGATLLSFFRWLLHPADTYHANVVKCSPLTSVLFSAKRDWAFWRQTLEAEGYSVVLRRVSKALHQIPGLLTDFHKERLNRWIQAAAHFDEGNEPLHAWLDYMENLTIRETPPKSFVHVMTIHQSKGLEYDAIILPFSGTKDPDATTGLDYLTATGEDGDITSILRPPSKSDQRAEWPTLMPHVEAWKEKQRRESENLLYVALTRAVHANYILFTDKAKPEGCCHAGRIRGTVQGLPQEEDPLRAVAADTPYLVRSPLSTPPGSPCFEYGNARWFEGLADREEPEVPMPQDTLLKPVPRRARKSPSTATDLSSKAAEEILSDVMPDPAQLPQPAHEAGGDAASATRRAQALEFGTAVHALLEQVEWWNPATAPSWVEHPQTLAEHVAATALVSPELHSIFTPTEGAEVYNEQTLEAVDDRIWTSAVIDRLILYPKDQRALVIDYKTNKSADGLKEHYLPQMREYRNLVAKATGYPITQVQVALVHLNNNTPPTLLRYSPDEFNMLL